MICGFFMEAKICKYYIMMIGDPAVSNSLNYIKISDSICGGIFCYNDKTIQLETSDFEKYLEVKYPETKNKNLPEIGKDFEILVLNDAHLQKEYKEGTLVDCGKPAGCCQDKWGKVSENGAGYWGTKNSNCDIPDRTFLKTLEFIKSKILFELISRKS
jgi:hypothetical protein